MKTKPDTLLIRLGTREKNAWKEAAIKLEMSTSEFVRVCVNDRIKSDNSAKKGEESAAQ